MKCFSELLRTQQRVAEINGDQDGEDRSERVIERHRLSEALASIDIPGRYEEESHGDCEKNEIKHAFSLLRGREPLGALCGVGYSRAHANAAQQPLQRTSSMREIEQITNAQFAMS